MSAKNDKIKNDALNNLKIDRFKSYSILPSHLDILEGWTYLSMLLFEAKASLKLCVLKYEQTSYEKIEHFIEANAMYKNFILSYAKCFSKSGKMRKSLDKNDIFNERKDFLIYHDQIMQIRNTFVAHNDQNEYDTVIYLTKETSEENTLAQTYTISTPIRLFKHFEDVVDYCEQQLSIRFNKKLDKIEKKINKKIIFKNN